MSRDDRVKAQATESPAQGGVVTAEIKREVREFYESVGWREIGEGLYQNARYEDLRPVSAEYLRRCHLRVARHLPAEGRFLLDAGSGPIQYPEYLEYSVGFRYRVCLDLSMRALREARARLGRRGLYVVGDVAQLPFADGCFGGVVSLHTVHHLPPEEHRLAFTEFLRALEPAGSSAVVYSWGSRSGLMRLARPFIVMANWARRLYAGLRGRDGRRAAGPVAEAGRSAPPSNPSSVRSGPEGPEKSGDGAVAGLTGADALLRQPGTYTFKHGYRWARRALSELPGMEVRVWRSVSTQFLRAFVHPQLQGQRLLRLLYWLEERFPHTMGRHGQYPLIIYHKPGRLAHAVE